MILRLLASAWLNCRVRRALRLEAERVQAQCAVRAMLTGNACIPSLGADGQWVAHEYPSEGGAPRRVEIER